MKTDYYERKQRRIERYGKLAEKAKEESDRRYNEASRIGKMIPFGQPILVGHHSERGHRADLKRIDNNMQKSIEAENKAKHYESRMLSAASNNSISSDNPDAKELLSDKVEALESLRDKAKRVNKELRKGKSIADMDFLTDDERRKFLGYLRFDGCIPTYFFSNLSARIRTAKQRKSKVESVERFETKEETFGDVRVLYSAEKNRVQIFFPCKPSDEIRKELKSSGFRWSPSEGAWQRHLTNTAIYLARSLFTKKEE